MLLLKVMLFVIPHILLKLIMIIFLVMLEL
jgi:hypothetical protein